MHSATEFTPWAALSGGILIGMAAMLMLYFNGRIAGISGIVGNLSSSRGADFWWRLAFTVGLILGAYAFLQLAPASALQIQIDAELPMLALAGLIVGVGTRLGKGCTSGHGVCGIGRVSPRSVTATAVFMAVAIVTVYLVRHVVGV